MALFLVTALGLAWLVAVPLWVMDALPGSAAAMITGALMTCTPTAGVVGVWWSCRRRDDLPTKVTWRWRTGVRLGFSTRPTGVSPVGCLLLPWLVPLASLARREFTSGSQQSERAA